MDVWPFIAEPLHDWESEEAEEVERPADASEVTATITLVNASEQCESLVVGVSVSGNSFVQLLEGSKAGVIRLASGREIPLFGLGSSRNLMCYVPKDLSLMENAAVALALLEQLKPRQTLLLDTIPEMQVHLESMPQLLRLSTRTSSLCKEIPVLPAPGVMTGFSACLLSMLEARSLVGTLFMTIASTVQELCSPSVAAMDSYSSLLPFVLQDAGLEKEFQQRVSLKKKTLRPSISNNMFI